MTDMAHQFMTRLHLIDASPPVTLKMQAIRDIAFSKIQHLFANVHIPQKVLRKMDNKTVNVVRKWFVSTHILQDVLSSRKDRTGGLEFQTSCGGTQDHKTVSPYQHAKL